MENSEQHKPRLRCYGVGNLGFIRGHVNKPLGLPPHIRQAKVIVVAPTKKRALELLQANPHVSGPRRIGDPEFRLADGYEQFIEHADGREGVYVMPLTGGLGAPVFDVTGADIRQVGEWAGMLEGYVFHG